MAKPAEGPRGQAVGEVIDRRADRGIPLVPEVVPE